MPPPTPVPRITPKTRRWPLPAPSVASESAKQFASFSIRTASASAAAMSAANGRPFSTVEFAFFIRPLAGDTAPGVPMPTRAVAPSERSRSTTRPRIASTIRA